MIDRRNVISGLLLFAGLIFVFAQTGQSSDCTTGEKNCENSKTHSTTNGMKYCCLNETYIKVSQNTINGVTDTTCICNNASSGTSFSSNSYSYNSNDDDDDDSDSGDDK